MHKWAKHNNTSPSRTAIYWLDFALPVNKCIRRFGTHFAGRLIDAEIVRDAKGKPYFAHEPQLYLSISHSAHIWACAFSDAPVGLDVQVYRENDFLRIAERFFHPSEFDYVRRGGKEAFFNVWTAKESYVKYTGSGIDGTFSKFSVIQNGIMKAQVNEVPLKHIPFLDSCSLCLCGSAAQAAPICLYDGSGL